jgi:hypothetical protein
MGRLGIGDNPHFNGSDQQKRNRSTKEREVERDPFSAIRVCSWIVSVVYRKHCDTDDWRKNKPAGFV